MTLTLLPYNSAAYYRPRDIPRLIWLGLKDREIGFGWALLVAWRVLRK